MPVTNACSNMTGYRKQTIHIDNIGYFKQSTTSGQYIELHSEKTLHGTGSESNFCYFSLLEAQFANLLLLLLHKS